MYGIYIETKFSTTDRDISKLIKRGPDNTRETITSHGTRVIFSRLCINDLSENGNQPFCNQGITVVCNGEIYNSNELRIANEFDLKSTSDCEVILPLFLKYGFVECVKQLHGVFSLCIIDNRGGTEKLYVARDRLGVRPMYSANGCEGQLILSSLAHPLNGCTNIGQVAPGIYEAYKGGLYSVAEWSCNKYTPDYNISFNDACLKVKTSLLQSVSMRMNSDVPIGCLLSGGLDSSLIVSIMSSLLPEGKRVRTYSVGMENSTDLLAARKVASYLNTDHHEIIFTEEEALKVIPEVIGAIESYDVTTVRASIGMYILCKWIKNNTSPRVIFSGEGSDELLQGYLYFHKAPTSKQGAFESNRLVNELYNYDVLRCDRCVSSNGLEIRVPFLDTDFVDLTLQIPSDFKHPRWEETDCEKYLLRKAFIGYLPEEILWRRKEGMSDGTGTIKRPLSVVIAEYLEDRVASLPLESTAIKREEAWYKELFSNIFPSYNLDLPMWLPRWSNSEDPSGRGESIFRCEL